MSDGKAGAAPPLAGASPGIASLDPRQRRRIIGRARLAALTGPAMMMAILHGEDAIASGRVDALASILLDGIRSDSGRRAAKRKGRRR